MLATVHRTNQTRSGITEADDASGQRKSEDKIGKRKLEGGKPPRRQDAKNAKAKPRTENYRDEKAQKAQN